MPKLINLTLLFIGFTSAQLCRAQTDTIVQPDSNYSFYLDDGTMYRANNALSINTLVLTAGYLNLNYQRKLDLVWSIEVGGSIKMYKGFEILPNSTKVPNAFVKGFGYSATVKHNLTRSAITNGFFLGFGFRNRNITLENYHTTVQNYFGSFGYQSLWKGRFTTELGMSIGGSLQKAYDYDKGIRNSEPMLYNNLYGVFFVKLKGYFFTN